MEIHSRFVSPFSLLISAYTVNKKHDSRLIRVTCYLLTWWQNLFRVLFKLKKKNKKATLFMKSLIKHAKGRSFTYLLPENTFLWKPEKRENIWHCPGCRAFPRKNYSSSKCWHFHKLLWFSNCFLEYSFGTDLLSVLQRRLSFNLQIQCQLKYVVYRRA